MALDHRSTDLPRELDAHALDQVFREARTVSAFRDQPIDDATLRRLYDLAKWGPTAFNASPLRLVFVRSPEAKQRLAPALAAANTEKTLKAPVTAIVAYDSRFFDHLPTLFPYFDARALYADNAAQADVDARRNGSLQAAYLIVAARALGLDAAPMSGFDNAAVDRTFLADSTWRSNILVNLGYGDRTQLYPRGPRLAFETVAAIV